MLSPELSASFLRPLDSALGQARELGWGGKRAVVSSKERLAVGRPSVASSKCAVKKTIDNQIQQVRIDLVIAPAKLVGDAHQIFDDVSDLVESEADRSLRRGHPSGWPTRWSAGRAKPANVFDPKRSHTARELHGRQATASDGFDELSGTESRFPDGVSR